MKKLEKYKWLILIPVAILIFTTSALVTRFFVNRMSEDTSAKVEMYDEKKEKEKFIDDNIKDEDLKETLKLHDKIEEAKEKNEDISEVIKEANKEKYYTEEYIRYSELSEEEKKKAEVIPRKEKIDISEFEKIKEDQNKDLGEISKEKEENKKKEDKKEENKKEEDKEENKKEKEKEEPNKEENKKEEEKEEQKKEENKKEEEKEEPNKEENRKEEEKEEPKKEENNKEDTKTLPEKFNLKDIIDIKVEKQGMYGLCWDFASTTCLETNLALTKKQNYDFSEIHIAYLTSDEMNAGFGRTATGEESGGGNFQYWTEYARERKSFVLEDELEYRMYNKDEYVLLMNAKTVDINVTKTVNFPNFFIENVGEEKFKEYQDIIKRHIMNYGALYTVIGSFDRNNTNIYYTNYSQWKSAFGHAVSIIGWDDNYPKENFTNIDGETPKNDGAYIALNSWGTDYGDNGVFYISYEDSFVHNDLNGVISTDEKYLFDLSKLNNKPLEDFIKEKYERKIITKNNKSYIYQNVLDEIWNLEINNAGLKSLKGIENFKNLYSLNVSNNEIEDISDIIKLPQISFLDLSNNKIKDVSVLEDRELIDLNLSGNKGVTGYEKCKIRWSIGLSNCDIKSVENVNKILELSSINLSNNVDIIDLEKINLDNILEINLSGCGLQNIDFMAKYEEKYYSMIDISNNDLQEIPVFNDKTTIETLNLSQNKKIKDYSSLNDVLIYSLEISDCNIEDLGILPVKNKNICNLNIAKNNISNEFQKLKEMTNLYFLNISNCNLKDVSTLNELKLHSINLSENEGVYGVLSYESLNELELENCKLDENFDFFGLKNIGVLYIKGNNIDTKKIPQNTMYIDIDNNEEVNAEVVYREIEDELIVPNGKDVYLYLSEVKGRVISINDKEIDYSIPYKIKFYNINEIKIENIIEVGGSYRGRVVCTYKIKKINDSKIEKIRLAKKVDKMYVTSIKDIDFSGMMVEASYGNGVYKNINDYKIEKKDMHEGINHIKILYNNFEFIYYGAITVTDEFGYVTLKFEDKRLYEANKEPYGFFDEEYKRDDEKMELYLTPIEVRNNFVNIYPVIPYESLDNIDVLKKVSPITVGILFSKDTDENAGITEKHLNKLKEFEWLTNVSLLEGSGKWLKDTRMIVQNDFKMEYALIPDTYELDYTLKFKDEKLYKCVRDEFFAPELHIPTIDNDEEKTIRTILGMANEYIKKLTIPYESLYDIKAISDLNIEDLTIVFSENTKNNAKILNEDIKNLKNLKSLKNIIIVDETGKRNLEDLIVEQNDIKVIYNGSDLDEKNNNEDIKSKEDIVDDDADSNEEDIGENNKLGCVLKFEDEKLYNSVLEKIQSTVDVKFMSYDDKKTIEVNLDNINEFISNLSILYESLYDIEAISKLEIEELTIVFSEDTKKDAKISKDDINNLNKLEKLKDIIIVDKTGKLDLENIMPKPHRFEVMYQQNNLNEDNNEKNDNINIENNNKNDDSNVEASKIDDSKKEVPNTQLEDNKLSNTLKFKDEKLYKCIIEKISEYPEIQYTTDIDTKTINVNVKDINKYVKMLTIPYESIYDIQSISKLEIEELTIIFSEKTKMDAKISQNDIENLNKLEKLTNINIVDETGKLDLENIMPKPYRFEVMYQQNDLGEM